MKPVIRRPQWLSCGTASKLPAKAAVWASRAGNSFSLAQPGADVPPKRGSSFGDDVDPDLALDFVVQMKIHIVFADLANRAGR